MSSILPLVREVRSWPIAPVRGRARLGSFSGVNRTRAESAATEANDPSLTSLAAAFKTAFERLSGSNAFGLMPDPSFFTFARLSLPPSLAVLMTRQDMKLSALGYASRSLPRESGAPATSILTVANISGVTA